MATYTVYELPFTARPQYVSVRLVGTLYRFKLAWNVPAQCWVVDIMNPDGTLLYCGMPLVTGEDLLKQFEYLGIRGQMVVFTDQTATGGLVPDFDDLGSNGHVYFMPDGTQPQ